MKLDIFDDNFNPSNFQSKVEAKSFMAHVKKHLDFLYELIEENGGKLSFGEKELYIKSIEKDFPLSTLNKNELKCFVSFNDEISFPILRDSKTIWMSHTPMEVSTCQKGIDIAKGSVLMGGLGLGYMANRILKKKNVSSLTIYETDKGLIDSIGKKLKEVFKDKIHFVNDSIYNASSNYDSIVVDIYKYYTSVLDDEKLTNTFPDFFKNKNKYWAWGYQTVKGLSYNAIESLRDNSREIDFYENVLKEQDLDSDEFYMHIDNFVFRCSCCDYYYSTELKRETNDGEVVCSDCFENEEIA